jgi:hypothetical protein
MDINSGHLAKLEGAELVDENLFIAKSAEEALWVGDS